MATISLEDATGKLTHAIEDLDADELVQLYNELFPDKPVPSEATTDPNQLRQQIIEHINGGLEPEEVVDLWSVAFPTDRKVYFNEEDGFLHASGRGRDR